MATGLFDDIVNEEPVSSGLFDDIIGTSGQAAEGRRQMDLSQPARSPEELAIKNEAARKELIQMGLVQPGPQPRGGFGGLYDFLVAPTTDVISKGLSFTAQQLQDAEEVMAQYAARAAGEATTEEVQEALAGPSKPPSQAAKVATGAHQAVVEAMDFFTSPLGIMTLGTAKLPVPAQRAVTTGFVADMARHVPEQLKEFTAALKTDDLERQAKAATALGLTGAFIKTGATHALQRRGAKEVRADAADQPQPVTIEPEVPSAISQQKAGEIVRGVPEQPVEGQRQVPTQEGAQGVPRGELRGEDAQGAVGDVPLAAPDKVEAVARKMLRGESFTQEWNALTPQERTAVASVYETLKAKESPVTPETPPPVTEAPQGEQKAVTGAEAEKPTAPEPVPKPTPEVGIPPEPAAPPTGEPSQSIGPGAASPAEFLERQTLNFQTDKLLPDFIERTAEREVFSQPYGVGRIPVMGRLLDPNASVRTAEQQALAAYWAAREGVAKARASYIGTRFGPEIRNAFQAVSQGKKIGDLNVTPRITGQSLKISDVFEALQRDPDAYALNPEQRRVWNEILKPILEQKQQLVKKYDLTAVEDASGDLIPHFHRIVTDFPQGKEPLIRRIGQSVGGRIPSQRGRVFTRSEREGWTKGYKYELDPVKRLVSDIERTYKAIADQRLINDDVFGGVTPRQKESQLRELYADRLASGEMTERGFQAVLDNAISAGRVFQPGFSSKVFTPETAQLLNNALQSGDSTLRKAIATGNDLLKATMLGFDVGVGQIQLLPTFFRNPKIWAEANWESLKAIVSPETITEFVKQHDTAVRELAEGGSSVGALQEFMAGVAPGALITRVPGGAVPAAAGGAIGAMIAGPPGAVVGGLIGGVGVGRIAKAFGRQFQTALDVAKIQLWEAWREVTPPEQRLAVIRTLESQLGSGRMESIGVGGRQALIERVLLLASSYYRGALNYVAALAEPGVSGKITRQGLTAFVGGGLVLYYGVAKMLGMSDEEIKKRLDPSRPDFMQWTMEGSEGRTINVGIGGIHRSLLRLAGNIVATSIKHPGNWLSLAADKNPISRWLRGHGAPLPQTAFTAFSGRDFMGEEADIGTIAGLNIPLTAQQFLRRKGEPTVTVKELAFSFAGLNAYPEAKSKQYIREREKLAEAKGGAFDSLPIREQIRISEQLKKRVPFDVKEPATASQIANAFKADVERRKRIAAALSPEAKEQLQRHGAQITGYEPTLRIGRYDLFLTRKQQDRYESLIVEEYNRLFSRINWKTLERLTAEQRQKALTKQMTDAKERARSRFIRESNRQSSTP